MKPTSTSSRTRRDIARVVTFEPFVLRPEAERALKRLASYLECAKDCPETIVGAGALEWAHPRRKNAAMSMKALNMGPPHRGVPGRSMCEFRCGGDRDGAQGQAAVVLDDKECRAPCCGSTVRCPTLTTRTGAQENCR